jgi:hypothetical protein
MNARAAPAEGQSPVKSLSPSLFRQALTKIMPQREEQAKRKTITIESV